MNSWRHKNSHTLYIINIYKWKKWQWNFQSHYCDDLPEWYAFFGKNKSDVERWKRYMEKFIFETKNLDKSKKIS